MVLKSLEMFHWICLICMDDGDKRIQCKKSRNKSWTIPFHCLVFMCCKKQTPNNSYLWTISYCKHPYIYIYWVSFCYHIHITVDYAWLLKLWNRSIFFNHIFIFEKRKYILSSIFVLIRHFIFFYESHIVTTNACMSGKKTPWRIWK